MTSEAREKIFARLARQQETRLAEHPLPVESKKWLGEIAPTPMPQHLNLDDAELKSWFFKKLKGNLVNLCEISSRLEIPQTVQKIINERNLDAGCELVVSPEIQGWSLDWNLIDDNNKPLKPRFDRARDSDQVSVTPIFMAIAETGTLMLTSDPKRPVSLNFLPDIHIAILFADQLFATMEQGFAQIRRTYGSKIPRTINFISGASRTGDIEGEILHGIHGPRHLYLIWIQSDSK